MTTLTVKDNSPEARKFLEFARTLSFVKDTTPPPCQYTVEELRAHVDESMEAYRRGDVIPHEEVFKRFEQWL